MPSLRVLVDQRQLTTRAADRQLRAAVDVARRGVDGPARRFAPGAQVVDLVTGQTGEVLDARTHDRVVPDSHARQ